MYLSDTFARITRMTLKLAKFANLPTMLMDISEFMQQDGRKKRTAKCMCVTNLTSYCLRVLLWFTLMFSGLLQKDLFKGGWSLAKNFTIFFPLPPCCVSSLLLLVFITTWKKKHGRIYELKPQEFFHQHLNSEI